MEIEEILRLSGRKASGSGALQQRMRDKVLQIDGKLADLYKMRQRLADALHAGCESLINCTCPASQPYVRLSDEQAATGER
jgi:hypothetical protein